METPRINRIIKRLGLKDVVIFLARSLYFLLSLIEIPLFLIANRKIFRNKIVYVFWHWSFGHTVSGIDYASRLYFPHTISVVYLPHRRSNIYLLECFKHNVKGFIFRSKILPEHPLLDEVKYRLMRAFVLLATAVYQKTQVLELNNLYMTLSLSGDRLKVGDEATGQLRKTGDITGYVRLLRLGLGRNPVLPEERRRQCQEAIKHVHPEFFNRPFMVLLLRTKGVSGPLDDAFRISGPQRSYVKGVKYAIDHGFHVAGTGETEHVHFQSLQGYYSLKSVDLDPKLLNVFLLSECALFLGQQSGPSVLLNSRGVPSLICDAMPYRLGTFYDGDVLLFKRLLNRTTGEYLSLLEIYRRYPELAYGFNFSKMRIDIEPNTEDEIYEAVREHLAMHDEKLVVTAEDEALISAFYELLPEEMTLYYQRNRPPLFVLRTQRDELLNKEVITVR